MNTPLILPNENIAANVVASMMNEKVLSSIRLATGDQHFVFAVKTSNSEYVLRMTKETNRNYCYLNPLLARKTNPFRCSPS